MEISPSCHSTLRVKKITYSVPSRLIGQRLRVEVHEAIITLWWVFPRLGEPKAIRSSARIPKPGASKMGSPIAGIARQGFASRTPKLPPRGP